MAGPQDIQRVPLGLLNVLSMAASGENPRILASQVAGVLELLQFYGLTQRQVLIGTDAALAEGGSISVTPSLTAWAVLFAMSVSVTKTATMTALRAACFIRRSGVGVPQMYASDDLGPFGATETGTASVVYVPGSAPLLLPPGTVLTGLPQIIGTDATAAVTVQAEIGLLG